MGLYGVKPWFIRRLRIVENALVRRRVSPDTLTLGAVGVSVVAGLVIAAGGLLHMPLLWLAVPPLVVVRLGLNALDGSVARRTRTSRPFGVVLNEVGDRVGDAATIGATSFVAGPRLALGALGCALFASSTGVLALAITGRRDSRGPMGKADRAAAIALGAVFGALFGSAVPFGVVLWVIAMGSLVTAFLRVRALRGRPDPVSAAAFIEIPRDCEVEEEMLDVLSR
ncbi:MAG: phosphatidate cytidylyltransferase [Actinomycetota bacterium]|nr:CDP-alcohol phosphatidyltransferase family protein [Actinomycetota bacterium]